MGGPPPIQPNVNVNIAPGMQQPVPPGYAAPGQVPMDPAQKPKEPFAKRVWRILSILEKVCLYLGGAIKGAREVHEEIIEEEKVAKQAEGTGAQQVYQQMQQPVQYAQPPQQQG